MQAIRSTSDNSPDVTLSRAVALDLMKEYTFHFGFNSLRDSDCNRFITVIRPEGLGDIELAHAIVSAAKRLCEPAPENEISGARHYMADKLQKHVGDLKQPFDVTVGAFTASYVPQ